jgi:hypothetical protein
LLYFKIKLFNTLIHATFHFDAVYNKRKASLMDPKFALPKTCIVWLFLRGCVVRIYLFLCCVLPYFYTACFLSRSSLLLPNSIGLVCSAFTYCLFPRLHQAYLSWPSYLSSFMSLIFCIHIDNKEDRISHANEHAYQSLSNFTVGNK